MEKTHSEERRISIAYYMAAMICIFFLWVVSAAAVPVIDNVVKDPTEVPPPIHRDEPATVTVNLVAQEVVANITSGKSFYFWTFNGTVPGPMVRVMEGDTVVVNLENDAANVHPHNIDFHAVMGPGGGASVTNVKPGETKSLPKNKVANFIWCNKSIDCDAWYSMNHIFDSLLFGKPKDINI